MKNILILLTLLTSCDEFNAQIESDPKEWTIYTIPTYTNYSYPMLSKNYTDTNKVKRFSFYFIADESWLYDIGENQSDINKLSGIIFDSWNNIHRFSVRFGWRYLNGNYEILSYTYLPDYGKEPIKEHLINIRLFEPYYCKLEMTDNYIRHSITDINNKSTVINVIYHNNKLPSDSWITHFYFGGDCKPPHPVTCTMKSDYYEKPKLYYGENGCKL